MTSNSVSGKVALLTGGASGIGFAFTKLLLSRGCSVIVGDLCPSKDLQALVDATTKTSNGEPKVLFKETDVSKWDQLNDLFSFAEQSLGPPDIVCPCAGIFEPNWSNFWTDTETDSYKTIEINCHHPVKATRLAVRSFVKANKPGTVVHVSSMGAQNARINVPIYCASKAFLSSFVRSMAALDKENIKVVAIAPGLVDTPLWTKENPERIPALGKAAFSTPDEIAEIMLALCEDSQYQGGTVLEASGQGRRRRVEILNDPGPGIEGSGLAKSASAAMDQEVHDLIAQERKSALEGEK